MSDFAQRNTGLTTAQTAQLDGAAQKAQNLADLASASSARTNIGLTTPITLANGGTGDLQGGPFAIGTTVFEVLAPIAGQNYAMIGFPTQPGYNGAIATTAPLVRGRRMAAPSTANSASDGVAIGGYNTETNNKLFFCKSTTTWTQYLFLATNAAVTFRGGGGFSANNPTDGDAVANNSCGIRLRPAVNAAVYAYSTDNAGVTTATTLGLTLATSTNYVFKITWDGTKVSVSYATINATTGVVSSFSTPVDITTNLPATTAGLAPTQKWWNHGATQPTIDVGGCQCITYLVAAP